MGDRATCKHETITEEALCRPKPGRSVICGSGPSQLWPSPLAHTAFRGSSPKVPRFVTMVCTRSPCVAPEHKGLVGRAGRGRHLPRTGATSPSLSKGRRAARDSPARSGGQGLAMTPAPTMRQAALGRDGLGLAWPGQALGKCLDLWNTTSHGVDPAAFSRLNEPAAATFRVGQTSQGLHRLRSSSV